ncbi:PWI domain-containing protein [Lactarius deliciosus]|nr:PWI domain-containing protein [Lactarius deliciosus]
MRKRSEKKDKLNSTQQVTMADAGTSADQDRRFSDKELKLLKTLKFPSQFDTKVDMRKVNLQVIRPWVTKKVVELLGLDDELVVEYAMGLLEDESQTTPDPKKMQINLTGFLTDSTPIFMAALWNLLIEAQTSPAGIPRSFVEEKKEEMRRANQGDTRALEERDRRQRLDEIRDRERSGRADRGGGRGRGRGGRRGRGGIGNDDRPDNRMRDNGWGGRGGTVTSTISLSAPSFSLTSAPWQDALQRSLISFG